MKRGTITIELNRITVSEGAVWMTAEEVASIFHVTVPSVGRHIKKIFAEHELDECEVRTEQNVIRRGKRYIVEYYNLDMVIALGFRIDTTPSKAFRQWIAKQVVKSLRVKTPPLVLQIGSCIS